MKKKKTWARGRKPFTDQPIVRFQIKLAQDQYDWLVSRGNGSAVIRELIDRERERADV